MSQNNKKGNASQLYEYDFGLSFSDANREIVESVAELLKKYNYTVFYDKDKEHELIGKDLFVYLRDLYHNKCKFVVVFLSNAYTQGEWPNLEMTAIRERLMETFFANDFLLPIIMEELSENNYFPKLIRFQKFTNVESIVKLLIDKFNSNLNEDIQFENMEIFISYLQDQLINIYIKKGSRVEKNTEGIITVFRRGKIIEILMTADTVTYSPYIKIYIDHKVDIESALPDILLTWSRDNVLSFKIYSLGKLGFNNDIIISFANIASKLYEALEFYMK